MNIPRDGWEYAGKFDVDSGTVWIGDPCYVLPLDKNPVGREWMEFVRLMCPEPLADGSRPPYKDIIVTDDGLGISTGYGDGAYPVYVRMVDHRPMQIFIDFQWAEDDDE